MGSQSGESGGGRLSSKKNHPGTSRKVHKAAREKQNRDRMNELFSNLGEALELEHAVHGKASVLRETIRLLGQIRTLVESLKKENAALVSEFNYVEMERTEIKEEVDELKTLQNGTGGIVNQEAIPAVGIRPEPVFMWPLHHHSDGGELSEAAARVSRPFPQYPSDSWPSHILSERTD